MSAGKPRLGSISKQGNRYLRGLFTAGALAVTRYTKVHRHRLVTRRPTKIAAITLANKIARIAWTTICRACGVNEIESTSGVM